MVTADADAKLIPTGPGHGRFKTLASTGPSGICKRMRVQQVGAAH
jgi:hypothetical protein